MLLRLFAISLRSINCTIRVTELGLVDKHAQIQRLHVTVLNSHMQSLYLYMIVQDDKAITQMLTLNSLEQHRLLKRASPTACMGLDTPTAIHPIRPNQTKCKTNTVKETRPQTCG